MKKYPLYFMLLCFTTTFFSCTSPTSPQQGMEGFKVVGYLPAGRIDTAAIPYQYLTDINYAFAIPAPDRSGSLLPVPQPDTLHALVKAAHEHGVRVFISVGGWNIGDGGGNDTRFEVLANSEKTRTHFVHSVMEVVRTFDLDGADIDWEYPDPTEPSSTNYELLMKQLADSLHPAGKKLTAAIVSYHDVHGYGITKPVFKIADWFNIMAYDDDYNTFRGELVPHAPYWLDVRAFDYWVKDRGMPQDKAVMGVPFYGKGRGIGMSYRRLLAQGANPYEDVYDSIYYNGIKTMKEKTALALKRGKGIMIWEIGGDTTGKYSLLRAIHEEINSDK
ncbi:MAG: glycoside hydrolase [Chitinophagaceae bacterium]|nr:MAG: glycoside hydrolase [Chitinophagaceae bacterium]